MAVTVSITKIINEATQQAQGNQAAAALAGQRLLVNFSDGTQLEFSDLAQAREWALGVESADVAQRLALARCFALSSDLTNTNQVVGKTCTLDLSNVSIFRVQ